MSPSVLRLPAVKTRTGLGRTSIYAGIKAGTFPAPVSIGARAVGWLDSAITEWIDGLPAAAFATAAAISATSRKEAA